MELHSIILVIALVLTVQNEEKCYNYGKLESFCRCIKTNYNRLYIFALTIIEQSERHDVDIAIAEEFVRYEKHSILHNSSSQQDAISRMGLGRQVITRRLMRTHWWSFYIHVITMISMITS